MQWTWKLSAAFFYGNSSLTGYSAFSLNQYRECGKTLNQQIRIFQFADHHISGLDTHIIYVDVNDRWGRINDACIRVTIKCKKSYVFRNGKG